MSEKNRQVEHFDTDSSEEANSYDVECINIRRINEGTS